MADCSYARCKQERAAIKRELSKWSKDMVHTVALETIAEELMGHRKWKQHQDNLMRSHLLLKFTNQSEVSNQSKEVNLTNLEEVIIAGSPKESIASKVKTEITDNGERETSVIVKKESVTEILNNNGTSQEDIKTVNVEAKVEKIIKDDPVINSIDWKPEDKCNFCIDGKLLTVNAKGDLVPESDPAYAAADLAKRNNNSDSDSDYSNSTTDTGFNPNSQPLTSLPPNMTSFDPSLAVRLAAHIYPNLMFQTLAQQMNSSTPTSDTSAMSPSLKDSPSPSDQQASAEQPLDLSSKTSPNLPNSADRNKVKPRLTPVTNRRQYTEDELHNALNDIMSGRLGTRRAAVIYKIPRSTLRNKVYKMSVEARRGATAQSQIVDEFVDADEGEDDKDSVDDDYPASQTPSMNHNVALKTATVTGHTQLGDQQKPPNSPSTSTTPLSQLSQTPPIGGQSNPLDFNLILHSIFLAHGISMDLSSPKIIEFYNLLKKNQQGVDSSGQRTPTPSAVPTSSQTDMINNGGNKQHQQQTPFPLDPRIVQHMQNNRLLNSDTPETAVTPSSSVDLNDDDPSTILKIPSYKPGAVSSSLTNKNGGNESLISPVPKIPNSILQAAVTQQFSAGTGISPPIGRHTNDSQSPPMINLRDVMANSINRNFNPHNLLSKMTSNTSQQIAPDSNDAYNKRPSISVIKNFGGTDLRDFASAPNVILSSNHHHNNSHHHQNMLNNAAGGKGTRPKRGKYRNYDRDSLVEAVKAVQRGEMSVHRAGSYYGVPHSTLEYKVKERHLMRPRKREPKQPIEERTGLNSNSTSSSGNSCNPANSNSTPSSSTPASSINSKSNSNIPGLTAVNNLDKLKSPLNIQQNKQQSGKSNPPFPNTSPNGLNMNLFDAPTNQLPYNYWTSGPYPGISSLDFPGRSDNMLQLKKFHEERNRQQKSNSMPTSSSIPNKLDSLYDAGNENGSFLDGIIRKAIDGGSSANLLEHLARPKHLDLSNSSNKRSGSPPSSAYPHIDIKRERSGTPKSTDDLLPSTTTGSAPSSTITTTSGDQHNGGSAAPTSILQEKLGKIKSETEDSL